jgi:hypothetical protein
VDQVLVVAGRWRSLLTPPGGSIADAQRAILRLLFLRLCEAGGIEREGGLLALLDLPDARAGLLTACREAARRYGGLFVERGERGAEMEEDRLREVLGSLYSPEASAHFARFPVEIMGQVYEHYRGQESRGERKAEGVYYTPGAVVERLVADTVGRSCDEAKLEQLSRLRVLDPSCGSGRFLLTAYRVLLDRHLALWLKQPGSRRRGRLVRTASGEWTLTAAERRRILLASIHGVDRDPCAVEIARLTLLLAELEEVGQEDGGRQLPLFGESMLPDLSGNLVCGDSVIGPEFGAADQLVRALDWSPAFPGKTEPGFDVVLGNPPWGQKEIVADKATKEYLRGRFPSSRGIFDWFRPFVEMGIRLVRPSGRFGMVLPDIVLLKDYEPTRRLLLEELALEKIEWFGMAFSAATIDAVSICGRRKPAESCQLVEVLVHDPARPVHHRLRQSDFRENPRSTFNLFLTDDKREVVRRLAGLPRLAEYFAPHEGIHSGNIRDELFVAGPVDDTCRELLFGRNEMAPYLLRWAGRYVRLGAIPVRRSPDRYANVGRPEWHERRKLLVRRTGDSVTAAVDEAGRYASNNFFLLVPTRACHLSLDGLCALLNSRFMTWLFRTIEPREGRAFAELKVKHLVEFPLPPASADCALLNELGARQRALAGSAGAAEERVRRDEEVQAAVLALFSIRQDPSRTDSAAPPEERRQGRPAASRAAR